MMAENASVRFGILGAARIVARALVQPSRQTGLAAVYAVAARSPDKAARFARRHRIPKVHSTYADLLEDRDIEAVYIPLPNSLHCEWTLRALRAGKHVLCEKPFAANQREAERMADAAAGSGLVLMEAFHYRYHPLIDRMCEIIQSGELGRLQHIETAMCIPLLRPGDIRYRYDLAGGALMDTGCYCIHLARTLAGSEPNVLSAKASLISPGVDRRMEAEMEFGDGLTGRLVCSLLSSTLLRVQAIVKGELGEMRVANPILPQIYHVVKGRTGTRRYQERVSGDATYVYQLRAFVQAVRAGCPILTGPTDAVANMKVIDAVYDAAGLRQRGA